MGHFLSHFGHGRGHNHNHGAKCCNHTPKSSNHQHSTACSHHHSCSHKNGMNSNSNSASAHSHCQHGQGAHCSAPQKMETLADRKALRARRRRAMQWGRRANQLGQNLLAAAWAWYIPESQLRIWFDYNQYDKLLLFHGLQAFSLWLFFVASMTEPGFIGNDAKDAAKGKSDEMVSLLSDRDDFDVEAGNVTKVDLRKDVPLPFCRNCEHIRPIRSKHCYVCDRCTARFDHHCPLLQQCVGARNYRQFFAVCAVQTVVSGWSLLMAKDIVFDNQSTAAVSGFGWFHRILLMLWMLGQTFTAGSLFLFHGFLICTQQTTYEFLKRHKLQQRIEYEKERGRFLDLSSKRKSGGGLCGMIASLLVEHGGGMFSCHYPFSEGVARNCIGFITGEGLERREYFELQPVVIVNFEPENEATNAAVAATVTPGGPKSKSLDGAFQMT